MYGFLKGVSVVWLVIFLITSLHIVGQYFGEGVLFLTLLTLSGGAIGAVAVKT